MSVIVTEMDMPKSCSECKFTYLDTAEIAFFGTNSERCSYNNNMICYDKRRDDCPLKSINRLNENLEEQKPKTGHWIYTLEDWNKWECSECGFTKRTDVHVNIGYKYCPNCGIRMIKEIRKWKE